jgi:RNA polymerase sigma-70 factor (ECF subfamily)
MPVNSDSETDARMPGDEGRLIQLARQGDPEACSALYDRHYDAVYRYCYYRVCDEHLAQDLTGEVFVRMVEKLERFEARGRPLLAWLYTIARNLVTDHHRHRAQAVHLPLDEASRLPSDVGADLVRGVDRKQEAECLAAALNHLTEEQRQVILLKFVQDMANAEIAIRLGKTEGAIKALQHRALNALRRALEKEQRYEAGF